MVIEVLIAPFQFTGMFASNHNLILSRAMLLSSNRGCKKGWVVLAVEMKLHNLSLH